MADTIVLVGGETLLGREVSEVFAETSLGQHLKLVAAAPEDVGVLTELGGEPVVLSALDPTALEDAAILVLAGSEESSRSAREANPDGLIIDLTYLTEEDPAATVRAPLVFSEDPSAENYGDNSGPQLSAHPAAIAIAVVLKRLNGAYPIARAVVHIFEPASERGKAGIEELQQQTVNLLSFQPLPKKVFDTQVAYTLLPQFGEEAPLSLQFVEERIERHLASLLERLEDVPMPSLKLVQAPVFHGTSFSFWVEFEDAPSALEIEDVLSRDPIDVRSADLEAPNNVSMAGQSGVSVGAITPDRNNGNAIWIWAAIDNLRLAAENAALIAREAI